MRYLKLYEAFDASILNNLNKIVKVGGNAKELYNDLEKLSKAFDFKLDKLTKNDIKYLKYDTALNIKGDKESISYLKFWFTKDSKYLGYTTTSNISKGIVSNKIELPQKYLTYLYDKYKIGGYIKKYKNIDDIKAGDYVICYCGDLPYNGIGNSINNLTIGQIYKDDNIFYIIQDSVSGSQPYGDAWRTYGDYSWALGTIDKGFNYDHAYLMKIDLDENLDKLLLSGDVKNDPMEWNLPLDSNFNQTQWIDHKENKNNLFDVLKLESNYAIVIDLDNLENKESRRDIIDNRKLMKKDAYALLTNDEIRKNNIDKYLSILFNKFNINDKSLEDTTKSLNILMLPFIKGEYFIINYLLGYSNNLNILYNLISNIIILVNSKSDIDRKDISNEIYDNYLECKDKYSSDKLKYSSLNLDGLEKKVFDVYLNIGLDIVSYIKKLDINTVYELKVIYYKLSSIIQIVNDNTFSNYFLLKNWFSQIDFRTGKSTYHTDITDNDIKMLNKLHKSIKVILK